jgi:hypothetical protein
MERAEGHLDVGPGTPRLTWVLADNLPGPKANQLIIRTGPASDRVLGSPDSCSDRRERAGDQEEHEGRLALEDSVCWPYRNPLLRWRAPDSADR